MSTSTFGPLTEDNITVGYIDPVQGYISNISISQANEYEQNNPGTVFIFIDGDNTTRYLTIDQVNSLTTNDLLPTTECGGLQTPQNCDVPPTIQIFGGGGVGATANAVIGADGSLLAIDVVDGGYGYQYVPQVTISDPCNVGSGAVATAIVDKGVIVKIVVGEPGNGYTPPSTGSSDGYPSTLELTDVTVTNPGINYNCSVDQLKLIPDNGAKLSYVCNPFGVITGVSVDRPGIGFTQYPTIYMDTETGINFSAIPVFSVIRDPVPVTGITSEKILQVTDLVGLKQTGYIDGKAYYGAVYYENGVRYAGYYKTAGTPIQVYDTLKESITGQVTTRPSAIEKTGTDVNSNNPDLNIPGTIGNTTGR